MKKLILVSAMAFATIGVLNSCSGRDDEPTTQPEKQDFTNANYIKSQMVGTWKFWGHKSPSCECWVYSGDVNNQYYILKNDNTYEYKAMLTSVIETGTYEVNPVIGNTNAALFLTYTENGTKKYRYVTLKGIEGNTVTVFVSSWDERYTKQ